MDNSIRYLASNYLTPLYHVNNTIVQIVDNLVNTIIHRYLQIDIAPFSPYLNLTLNCQKVGS